MTSRFPVVLNNAAQRGAAVAQRGFVMRMLMTISFPNGEFNAAVKDGTAGSKIRMILEDARPEAVYFTERNGQRTGIVVVDVDDVSKVPAYAEPWFLIFNASVEFRIAMTPADLEKAGLEELGKRWS